MKHLLFYDGDCGLCDHVVQFVLRVDKHKRFVFAPLQGEVAKELLKDIPKEVKHADSLILIEDYQTSDSRMWIYGKGAFRIAWLLGGSWALFGWICFLPSILYDWGYRLIARYRHELFSKSTCQIPDLKKKTRFLS